MGWFTRPPEPVPLAPRHRRVWRRLRRRCSCGLPWKSCPDRHATVPVVPAPAPRRRNRPPWADATVASPQVGRVGRLTPAQSWRANGGHW
jgi:hypothetical protein